MNYCNISMFVGSYLEESFIFQCAFARRTNTGRDKVLVTAYILFIRPT
jgi:hypothetical protein